MIAIALENEAQGARNPLKMLPLRSIGAALSLLAMLPATAQVNVTTYHNDNMRTGWNPGETVLTQNDLGTFGLLQSVQLDDQVDAEPLLVSNETIKGGKHNVVYVATEGNSVYAIDAQSGQVLLHANLGTPVPQSDLPAYCGNNGPRVGIDSTPVIDTAAGALYVIAYVLRHNVQTYVLHALSLTTLADLVPPATISASALLTDGSVYRFDPAVDRQRPALLLANGNLYAGFGSFCDVKANRSRGWVLGWQASTLSPLASNQLNNTRAKSPNHFFLTSVWMSGYGLSANKAGSVYFVTGNSDYSGTTFNKQTNISESAAMMSGDLSTLEGLFTPGNQRKLDQEDDDFGSGGLMLLPAQQGIHSNLAAAAGKDGTLYLLNADKLSDSLGRYTIGGCYCGPSYFLGSDGLGRVITSGGRRVIVWGVSPLENGGAELIRHGEYAGIANGQNGGFFTSVSSNGTAAGTAVIWAVGRPIDRQLANVSLYAIDPDNQQLLFSGVAGRWPHVRGDANIVPMVANGFVYVASDQMLTIFGPGGTRQHVVLPATRDIDVRQPLAPGEHEIYGIVRAMNGDSITVEREGRTTRIDATLAKRASRFAAPTVRHGLMARGRFAKSGVLRADTVLHAVNHPLMWPRDR